MALLTGCARDVRTPPAGEPGFELTVAFHGEAPRALNASQRDAVRAAAARWSQHVRGDLPALWVEKGEGACARSPAEPAFHGVLDDVHVFVTATEMDGPGGLLAQAGPCGARPDGTSMFGVVRFDAADLPQLERQGELGTVALHELGHVLGIGAGSTWWGAHLRPSGGDCFEAEAPGFVGPRAVDAWREVSGDDVVPLESGGGPRTACAHWHGVKAFGELMIGWLAGDMRITGVSLGALADLGYEVHEGDAARLEPSGSAPSSTAPGLGHDEVLPPGLDAGDEGFRVRPMRPGGHLDEGERESHEGAWRRPSPVERDGGPSLGPCDSSRARCSWPSS